MAVTLKDVAKRAGISPAAVSLVLNKGSQSKISPETQDKILEAVKELGYQPSKSPQNSAFPIPPTIGLVITDIANIFFTELARVIEQVASRYGYNIILCNTETDLAKEAVYLDALWRRRVDGLIITPVDRKKSKVQDFLKHGIPVVCVDRHIESVETNEVLIDNVKGAYLATEYLLQLGHRRIGLVNGLQNCLTGRDRLQGYLQALQAYQIAIDDQLIQPGYFSAEGGRSATENLLNLSEPPTAIFSAAGLMTKGCFLALKHHGVRIPNDLSLISFDNVFWMELVDPPLTVIAQPLKEIGTEAAQLIIQLVQGWETEKIHQIVLQPELIVRESCQRK